MALQASHKNTLLSLIFVQAGFLHNEQGTARGKELSPTAPSIRQQSYAIGYTACVKIGSISSSWVACTSTQMLCAGTLQSASLICPTLPYEKRKIHAGTHRVQVREEYAYRLPPSNREHLTLWTIASNESLRPSIHFRYALWRSTLRLTTRARVPKNSTQPEVRAPGSCPLSGLRLCPPAAGGGSI